MTEIDYPQKHYKSQNPNHKYQINSNDQISKFETAEFVADKAHL
ncbi:hypothetical protein D1AOALGA4SA_12511 [Olavius algarvensis Delta 1 endosymbiont]|nr:hypothetical protein D1AOALGA4SA_12511 [Olavius algarvensis Delta 1 endosymbiont]